MSRTSDQVLQGISGNLIPDGWAWNHDQTSNTMRSFRPLADFASAFETAAEAQLFEATPETAEQMLGAYERVLGPDPCLGDPATLTFDERRMSASARWTSYADPSVQGLVALAAAYGVTITITEVRRNVAGVLQCGSPLVCHPEEFCFIVNMPAARVIPFQTGASRCADPLGQIENNTQIECVIRRAAPERTVPIFNYGAP
jgi:uncharacterized protein YmfQ (DUF2313 family)